MRVGVVTWRFPEPTEPFIVAKVAGLVERGCECVVFTGSVATDVDPPAFREVRDRVEVVSTGRQPDRRFATSPLLTEPVDVLHFEHAGVALTHRHLLPHLRVPVVVSCRGSTVRVDARREPWLADGLTDVFSAVDRIHCVSDELAGHCRRLGARDEQLLVAPTGVDLHLFRPRPGPPRPDGLALHLVSVGRLHWVKGYEYAVAAVRILRDRGHRVTYTIVGADDGAEAAIRLAVSDFGLEEAVTLMGHLPPEGVSDLLVGSDVFVLPSLSEGASGATMQAMASGLPVVVTDVGGMREIVRDGVDGHLVPARDPAALASAVERLVEPEVRRDMGARGAAEAKHRFDADDLADRLVALYETLVAERSVDRPARVVSPAPAPDRHDLLSVVVAARNAAATIDDQLRALSFQHHDGPWEVVVVDNGSTDGTAERARAWADRLPGLRVIDARERPGVGYARNVGVRAAGGARIVMCDADDVVAPGWLPALAGALERSPLAVGALERSLLAPGSGEDPTIDAGAPMFAEYRPKFLTCNCGFHREVFDAIGGFDEALARGCDSDFGWRATDRGFDLAFAGDAVVHYAVRWKPAGVLRSGFADGRARPALYSRHAATGMPVPLRAEVVDLRRTIAGGLRPVIRTIATRRALLYDLAQCAGIVAGSLEHRVRSR